MAAAGPLPARWAETALLLLLLMAAGGALPLRSSAATSAGEPSEQQQQQSGAGQTRTGTSDEVLRGSSASGASGPLPLYPRGSRHVRPDRKRTPPPSQPRRVLVDDAPNDDPPPPGAGSKYQDAHNEWQIGDWGACSQACGVGRKTREAWCVQRATGYVVAAAQCHHLQVPETERPCNLGACLSYAWTPGPWSDCSAECGGGYASRSLVCASSKGAVVSDAKCDPMTVPATEKICGEEPCVFGSCMLDSDCPGSTNCSPGPSCSDGCSIYNNYLAGLASGDPALVAVAPYAVLPSITGEKVAQLRDGQYFDFVDEGDYDEILWRNSGVCYRRCRERHRNDDFCEIWKDGVVGSECIHYMCDKYQGCHDNSDYYVPMFEECLVIELCTHGVCTCPEGLTGPKCQEELPAAAETDVALTHSSCVTGVVAADGTCCPGWSEVDAEGNCCAPEHLDACHVCHGSAVAVDALGTCCAGQLDAGGVCCTDGQAPDECGICGGDSSSCTVAAKATLNAESLQELQAKLGGGFKMGAALALAGMGVSDSDLEVKGVVITAAGGAGEASEKADLGIQTGSSAPYVAELKLIVHPPPGFEITTMGVKKTLEAHFRLGGQRETLLGIGRLGACGNGVCEVGEAAGDLLMDSPACATDCPYSLLPEEGTTKACNRMGIYSAATETCQCFQGYSGPSCQDCQAHYISKNDTCVPYLALSSLASAAPNTQEAASVTSTASSSSVLDPKYLALLIALSVLVALVALGGVVWRSTVRQKGRPFSRRSTLSSRGGSSASGFTSYTNPILTSLMPAVPIPSLSTVPEAVGASSAREPNESSPEGLADEAQTQCRTGGSWRMSRSQSLGPVHQRGLSWGMDMSAVELGSRVSSRGGSTRPKGGGSARDTTWAVNSGSDRSGPVYPSDSGRDR